MGWDEFDRIVRQYPGWPDRLGGVWQVMLRAPWWERVFDSLKIFRAVSAVVDEVLAEPNPAPEVQQAWWAAKAERIARRKGRMGKPLPKKWKELKGPWMPTTHGEKPRTTDEPGVMGRPVRKVEPWRWRLLAFVYMPERVWLVIASPVAADPTWVHLRLRRHLRWRLGASRVLKRDEGELRAMGGRAAVRAANAVARRERAAMMAKIAKARSRPRPPSRFGRRDAWSPQEMGLLALPGGRLATREGALRELRGSQIEHTIYVMHRLPVTWKYVRRPEQWWWSSYYEYAAPEPERREGVPLVWPLRADPRRPWDGGIEDLAAELTSPVADGSRLGPNSPLDTLMLPPQSTVQAIRSGWLLKEGWAGGRGVNGWSSD